MPRIRPHPNPTVRRVLLVSGWLFVILGSIGIVLPVVPTAPFVIVAAMCFLESSPRFYHWLANHRLFGIYVQYYVEGYGIPEGIKVLSISMLWAMMTTTALFIVEIEWLSIVLFVITVGVSFYLAAMPEPGQ